MRKKLTNNLILSLVLIVSLFGPLSLGLQGITANTVHAQTEGDIKQQYGLPACVDFREFSMVGCAAQAVYWVLWAPTHWLASKAAGFMDFFIFYSISGETYRGVPIPVKSPNGDITYTSFIREGWKVVRDISNILFIFGLLYVAIGFVLRVNIAGANPKKILVYVIVMALLINFSLFLSQVVVDAGNILARTLYNQISLVNRGNASTDLENDEGIKSIGLMVLSLTNPQKLLAPGDPEDTSITYGNTQRPDGKLFLLVALGATIFNVILIFTFVSMAIYFVARIIGLYISMIFSPFAFASLAVPKASSISNIGFNSWISNLVNYAFMAPLFIFFIYLTVRFLSIGIPINPSILGGASVGAQFMSILIPFALVMGFLIIAKNQAKKMSGEIGSTVASVTTKAIGGIAAVGIGGTALAGRAVIGRGAKMLASSSGAKNLAETGKVKLFGKERDLGNFGKNLGKATVVGGTRLSEKSFDLRGTKAAKRAGQIIGAGASLAGPAASEFSSINIGQASGSGGYAKYREDLMKKRQARLQKDEESLQMSGLEAKEHDKKAGEHNKGLEADKAHAYEEAKAKAEESYTKTNAYKSASNLEKERMLKAMREQFDKDYKKGKITISYDQATGKATQKDAKKETLDQDIKEIRRKKVLEQLEQSQYWATATDQQKEARKKDVSTAFDRAYERGEVITGVNSQGLASSQNKGKVEDQSDIDEQWKVNRQVELINQYADDAKYKRMQTSTEINRQRSKEFAMGLQERGRRSISRSEEEATAEYAFDAIKKAQTDALSAQHITKLTNNLNNLNDTLGSFLHLEQQGGFDNLSAKDLINLSEEVDETQVKDALKRAEGMSPREIAKVFESMSAKMAAEIAVLDAQIKATDPLDTKQISELARQKQLLENKRKRIQGGFEEQARLTTQINNARGK